MRHYATIKSLKGFDLMVIHIMNDGSTLTDISGHVVKMNEAPGFYQLLDQINKETRINHDRKKA